MVAHCAEVLVSLSTCFPSTVLCYFAFVFILLAAVDGGWGHWTMYTACSHSCGNGMQSRYRYCNSPRPSDGGQWCNGDERDIRPCHVAACPSNILFMLYSDTNNAFLHR